MHSLHGRAAFGAAFLLLVRAAYGWEFDVHRHVLNNGMLLLVHEDHSIPTVTLEFFFKVGSRNERPGTTGISHFFEHMMFNGSRRYGPGQFDILMEKNGGDDNAYTTRDVTVYTDSFPRSALELVIEMEADRIGHLSFDPKMIASERAVVESERRTSIDDDNFGLLLEQLRAVSYLAHPYRWPVLGWSSDIRSWTIDDLRRHYAMGYAPNNCVLVASGDASDAEVLALARRYLEPIPPHAPPPPVTTREPAQLGERRLVVRKPAQLPLWLAGYHVPASRDPDDTPLRVLGALLAEGRSSRLSRRLVDQDALALSVDSWQRLCLDPGDLIFSISPAHGADLAKVETAFQDEVAAARDTPAPAEELLKAKNLMLADFYRNLSTSAGKADLLGRYQIFYGDYRRLFAMPAAIQAVSAADVQRVARCYLEDSNLTVATLIPETAPQPRGVSE